jgi:predicted pyridoxine 5'-phosphate oxidase superfamily flavin-nucleotide-binding protein
MWNRASGFVVNCLCETDTSGKREGAGRKRNNAMAAKLTADMKRVVMEQRLAFVATVCPDGTPNLSPKGTIAVWDDDHLVFADIRSPGTIANINKNPAMDVNC